MTWAGLLGGVALGALVGAVHFALLWRAAQAMVHGRGATGLHVVRWAVSIAALAGASQWGAATLLGVLPGFLAVRLWQVRRKKTAA